MRVLVYPHDMGIGGSQLNAIQLAAAIQSRGDEAVIYGQRGPLLTEVESAGLEFIESPRVHSRPTPAVIAHLAKIIRARRIDIAHGYEWPPTLEIYAGCILAGRGIPVSTVLSMAVAPFVPMEVPLAVGTEQIAEAERAHGRPEVELLVPPVDLDLHDWNADYGARDLLSSQGLHREIFTVSIVSRLSREMKLEGILSAIDAVEQINREAPAQLIIAGSGKAQREVALRAEQANDRLGAVRIVCTGELADPRPVYQAADVGLGMGGSALRSMALKKPMVVQGERGYWRLLTEETLHEFLWQGWYGIGNDPAGSAVRLAGLLAVLRANTSLRLRLGSFARRVVEDHYALDTVSRRQSDFYSRIVEAGWSPTAASAAGAAVKFAMYQADRLRDRVRGTVATEDFNARSVLGRSGQAMTRGRA